MTETPNVGFSVLGLDKDAQGGTKEKRWTMLRPSVAFATQEEIRLDTFYLAYREGQEELRDRVCQDIAKIHSERNRQCRITPILIAFEDIYDFGGVFLTLANTIEKHSKDSPGCWHLSLGSGTHTMQFAMYIMADKQMLTVPLKLVHATEEETHEGGCTFGSHATIIDWPSIPEYRSFLTTKRADESAKLLHASQSGSLSWAEELEKIGVETNEPLLFTGETGTGKSRQARIIHEAWAARKNPTGKESLPFKEANCAALTKTLAQSELFGHKKGSFTGAESNHTGLLESANGGTLFLDEIGDLDLETQAKLLIALETSKFYRLGDWSKPIETEFRLICATNRDLTEFVAEGKFRLDLYARIRNWIFEFRPLRDLSDDIPGFVANKIDDWNREKRRTERRSRIDFKPDALHEFTVFAKQAEWLGNHRDLKQSINRMATLASLSTFGGSNQITCDVVRHEISKLNALWAQERKRSTGAPVTSKANITADFAQHIRQTYPSRTLMNGVEYALQQWILTDVRGNQAKACRAMYGSKVNESAFFCRKQKTLEGMAGKRDDELARDEADHTRRTLR